MADLTAEVSALAGLAIAGASVNEVILVAAAEEDA